MAYRHDPISYTSHGRLSNVSGVIIGAITPSVFRTTGGEAASIVVNNAGTVTGTVLVDATPVTAIVSWANRLVVVTMPAMAAGTHTVTLTTATGSSDTYVVTYYSAGSDGTFVVEADSVPEVNAYP